MKRMLGACKSQMKCIYATINSYQENFVTQLPIKNSNFMFLFSIPRGDKILQPQMSTLNA